MGARGVPGGPSIQDSRFKPLRVRIRLAVDAGTPVRAARYTDAASYPHHGANGPYVQQTTD